MTCLVCARTREEARSRENQLPSSPPLPLPRCGGNATHGEYPENINRHTTILQLSAHAYRVIGHWTGLSCRAHDAAGEDVSVSRDAEGSRHVTQLSLFLFMIVMMRSWRCGHLKTLSRKGVRVSEPSVRHSRGTGRWGKWGNNGEGEVGCWCCVVLCYIVGYCMY
jgi:hypothetical protein